MLLAFHVLRLGPTFIFVTNRHSLLSAHKSSLLCLWLSSELVLVAKCPSSNHLVATSSLVYVATRCVMFAVKTLAAVKGIDISVNTSGLMAGEVVRSAQSATCTDARTMRALSRKQKRKLKSNGWKKKEIHWVATKKSEKFWRMNGRKMGPGLVVIGGRPQIGKKSLTLWWKLLLNEMLGWEFTGLIFRDWGQHWIWEWVLGSRLGSSVQRLHQASGVCGTIQ